AYDEETLPPAQRRALRAGWGWLIECGFDDVGHLAELDWPVADCYLAGHLTARYLPRYTPLLVKQFFVCILTVAWKLAQPERHPLTCVAEELALRAIIVEAAAALAEEGEEVDFSAFEDDAYEDTDFEYLFT